MNTSENIAMTQAEIYGYLDKLTEEEKIAVLYIVDAMIERNEAEHSNKE